MNIRKILKPLSGLILVVLITACSGLRGSAQAEQGTIASESILKIIAKYQTEIPEQMEQERLPGLAIAVVDDQNILWQEGFGYTDWDRRTPVTSSTVFSIQSMSKSFTATAAMFAAQDGLLDLDAPITTYLPDFHVNSIFEEHPEQKMTMRMLLSHTAGFDHETGYGGNFDHPPYDFERHIASISDTWLMFPVGTRYSYSNLGIDLAGYILQVRSGMPFVQYVQEKVLVPLGMKDSTLDIHRLRANPTRAIGHAGNPLQPPVDFLLIPSGGVWASTSDMARYLQFHINKGLLNETRLLREDLLETMYSPPNAPANLYAQGVVVTTSHGARHIEHGGGGFGFNSNMAWYPELKLGVVVLTNGQSENGYAYQLSEAVLDSIIQSNASLYDQRAASAVKIEPAYLPSRDHLTLSNNQLQALIERKALPDDTAAQLRREAAAGTYIVTVCGFPTYAVEIRAGNNKLAYRYPGTQSSVIEVQPGLYFSPDGHALDLRGQPPTLANIRLIKANTGALPIMLAFFMLCGLLFLSTLIFWPAHAAIRQISRRNSQAAPTGNPNHKRGLVWTGFLAGLASLFSLACLAFIALIPNLIYVPWPRPFADLPWWQAAVVGLPFANLLLAAGVILLAVFSLRKNSGPRALYGYYLAVGLALAVFNGWIL